MLVFSDHKHFNEIISVYLRFLHAACGVPMKQRTIIRFGLPPWFRLLAYFPYMEVTSRPSRNSVLVQWLRKTTLTSLHQA